MTKIHAPAVRTKKTWQQASVTHMHSANPLHWTGQKKGRRETKKSTQLVCTCVCVYDTSPQAAAITSYRRGMRKKVGKTVTASAESLRRCIEINTLGNALFLKPASREGNLLDDNLRANGEGV